MLFRSLYCCFPVTIPPIVSFSLQTGIRRREVQKGDEIVSKEEYERLWISDDEFLDDDHRGINNKEILRLQIRLT